mgnify:CR=1 FL=1
MQNFSTLISVSIDGKRLFSFKSLELKQSINEHHTFTLILDPEKAGRTVCTTLMIAPNGWGRP